MKKFLALSLTLLLLFALVPTALADDAPVEVRSQAEFESAIANNATHIVLMQSISLTSPGVSAIIVDDDFLPTTLLIDGNGHTLQFLDNPGRIMNIQNTSLNVTIQNLTFTGGSTSDYGGALRLNVNSYKLIDCTFTNNRTTQDNAYAGAIYAQANMDSHITGCTFSGNSSTFGGAVYIDGFGKNSEIFFEDCTFNSNSASAAGGAVRALSSSASFVDCSFTGNSAGPNTEGFSQDGGAVNIKGPSATFAGCSFSGNSTAENGGAIYLNPPTDSGTISATIDDCTFTDNSAVKEGGAVYLNGASSTLEVSDCIVSGNTPDPLENGGFGGNGQTQLNNVRPPRPLTPIGSDITSDPSIYNPQVPGAGGGASICNEYVVIARKLNIRKGMGTDTQVLGQYTRGTSVKVLEIKDGWAKIEYGADTAYLSMQYLTPLKLLTTGNYCVNAGKLNVRTACGLHAERLGYLYSGDFIEVLEVLGDWARIEFSGQTGYVNIAYLK